MDERSGNDRRLGTNPKDLIGIKKLQLSLVPPASKIYQALAMQDGAKKYGPYNWRTNKVFNMVYLNAAMRHLESYLDGEECAEDSGYPHLGHALACIGIIVDAKETGNLVDDRPTPGVASQLLAKFTKKDLPPATAEQPAAPSAVETKQETDNGQTESN